MLRRLSVIVLLLVTVGFILPGPHGGSAQGQVYTDSMDSPESGLLSTETFDPAISFAYQNGQFVVNVQHPGYDGDITSSVNVPAMANSRLTVDASIAGSPTSKFVFTGCRHTDAGEGYVFGYWPASGDLLLWRRDVSEFQILAESNDPALVNLSGSAFQIGIDCAADTLTGFVNGQPLLSATDTNYPLGRPMIGLGANGQYTDGLTVAFDNLVVTDNGSGALAPVPTTDTSTSTAPQLPPIQGSSGTYLLFDQTRTAVVFNPPLVEGLAGSFIQESAAYSFVSAGVDLSDFYVIATFTNPTDASFPFDIGIGFRAGPQSNSGLRLTLTSDGSWYMQIPGQAPYASGMAAEFVATPGGANTIEILVQGASGTVAVNGILLPPVDLSAVTTRGDIYLGTGFYAGNSVAGRIVPYSNWWVFPTDILDFPSG